LKRSKRKPTRLTKLTSLLKELPPKPSATAARWDANCSPEDYVRRASDAIAQTKTRLSIFREASLADSFTAERHKMEVSESLFHEAKFQLLEPEYGLLNLLNEQNWASERPKISLHVVINQRGNLALKWNSPGRDLLPSSDGRMHLVNTTGLKDEFFQECWYHTEAYGNVRPPAELLRFRNVPLRYSDGSDHPATRCVMYAIRCRFEAIINQVKKVMDAAPIPKVNFTQDDEKGLELVFSHPRRSGLSAHSKDGVSRGVRGLE
jgi:hypothetical protein